MPRPGSYPTAQVAGAGLHRRPHRYPSIDDTAYPNGATRPYHRL
jgi:hypothetical protein